MHSGTNSVYSAAINSFLCPSSPGPATINYFNTFWGPYGDGGGDVCTPGAPAPPSSVSNLNPPPIQIWGRTDYFPIPGLHNTALQAAGMSPAYIAAVGEGKDSGTITGPQITGTIRHGLDHRRDVEHDDGLGVRIKADRIQRLPADLQFGGRRPARRRDHRARQQRRRRLGRQLHLLQPGRRPGTAKRHPRRHVHGQLHEQQRDLLVSPRRSERPVR